MGLKFDFHNKWNKRLNTVQIELFSKKMEKHIFYIHIVWIILPSPTKISKCGTEAARYNSLFDFVCLFVCMCVWFFFIIVNTCQGVGTEKGIRTMSALLTCNRKGQNYKTPFLQFICYQIITGYGGEGNLALF